MSTRVSSLTVLSQKDAKRYWVQVKNKKNTQIVNSFSTQSSTEHSRRNGLILQVTTGLVRWTGQLLALTIQSSILIQDQESTRQNDDQTRNQIFNGHLPYTMSDYVDTQQEDQRLIPLCLDRDLVSCKRIKVWLKKKVILNFAVFTCLRRRLQIGTVKVHRIIAQGVTKDLYPWERQGPLCMLYRQAY